MATRGKIKPLTGVVLILCTGLAACERARRRAVETVQERQNQPMAEYLQFRDHHVQRWQDLERQWNAAWWHSAVSGGEEDFARTREREIAVRRLHADREKFQQLESFKASGTVTDPLLARSLDVLYLAFAENQIAPSLMERIVALQTQLERTVSTFRPRVDGQLLRASQVRQVLRESTDTETRQRMWEASKEVGALIANGVVELAGLRNEAARALGFTNYYDMMLSFREQEPEQIKQVFDELALLTDEPFRALKAELDVQLGQRFNVPPDQLRPWHMADPFFQEGPPTDLDLDRFFASSEKDHLATIATRFFEGLGLPAVRDVLARSDLYERDGKVEHAFCAHIDRNGDVRVLANLKNNGRWMSTLLHELGHALYEVSIDRSLPFELRQPAHIFATEGVAELFGTLTRDPLWLQHHGRPSDNVPPDFEFLVRRAYRREMLIFARWSLVMVHFEQELYRDPSQDLNAMWWTLVERYQGLRRPPGRENHQDFATKIHLVVAPVYYHNYMLGRLYAAQLRHRLSALYPDASKDGVLNMEGQRAIGQYLVEHVFRPGSLYPWPEFVRRTTGEDLTARHFAETIAPLPPPPLPPVPTLEESAPDQAN